MKSKNLEIVLLILIFTFSFYIRINHTVYPYFDQDLSRDYLVASHIVNYGEAPLNGPSGQIKNSPFYYYFLAGLLAVNDSIVFLGWANIIFQLAVFLTVYLLAKNMFGRTTSIISLLLFSGSQFAIIQSEKIWQPNLMSLFVNLSFLLLLCSYTRKSYRYLIASIVTFVLAGALHNSAFVMAPIFIFVAALILKNQKAKSTDYIVSILVFVLSFLIFYAPLLYYLSSFSFQSSLISEVLSRTASILSPEFISNLVDRTKLLFATVFVRGENLYLLVMLSLATIYYYRLKQVKKIHISLLIFAVFQFIFVASFLKLDSSFPFPDRYFTPILSLFIILVSEICNRVFSRHVFFSALKFGIVAALFYQTAYAYDFKNTLSLPVNYMLNITDKSIYYPRRRAMEENIIAWIEKEIIQIQKENHLNSIDFFQFRAYLFGKEYPYLEAPFYVFLEKDFKIKFTKISDSDSRGFIPLTKDDYIFFICRLTPEQLQYENCADIFIRLHSNYKIIKIMSDEPPYVVNIAEKLN